MRLGCTLFAPSTIEELRALCDKLDCYGLSAIIAPRQLEHFTEDEAIAYGEEARKLGIVIGEAGFWENLLTDDADLRASRMKRFRTVLRNAELMGCRSTNTLVGTKHPSDRPLFPDAYNFTEACKAEFREIVLRALDGIDLKVSKYGVEPWYTSFFYQPEDIRAFIDSVDHPRFGVHMDQGNMISHASFYDTTSMIERTFKLLADKVVSVHIKDIQWEGAHFGLRWNEVYIGEGTMDLTSYLKKIATLDADVTCYCEHFAEERDYAVNFARLHQIAKRAGTAFLPRSA
ncbi:MAG: sugar phosphate isomerase/epimerase [Chelatococcus sp.]|uniref:sugar phosphate isomerase/epimerase family protein n=1 Tax=unclassified Chelatococcus TaxID=2638111 RepID=UPI001BCC913C|nr:TIM barrel protein [Chelatococcus sp.]MBS7743199.1 sugar phosphate isomerase/epimerase [Chelatococcus sp. HY11]CAH1651243.1 Sugar phosphate isomerase/epimerase [Hyphomicrobiales bacterium]MBX3538273.1 sugar phosphate isomerase/epimerase [Chelatococcus sp.]MBX3541683.1 sugar phosphate isomerase/epimerase [Chelatococcus sp.]MCO5074425.1 sugar phosphate isomerase/epimerase [Chelatococcus sp.]